MKWQNYFFCRSFIKSEPLRSISPILGRNPLIMRQDKSRFLPKSTNPLLNFVLQQKVMNSRAAQIKEEHIPRSHSPPLSIASNAMPATSLNMELDRRMAALNRSAHFNERLSLLNNHSPPASPPPMSHGPSHGIKLPHNNPIWGSDPSAPYPPPYDFTNMYWRSALMKTLKPDDHSLGRRYSLSPRGSPPPLEPLSPESYSMMGIDQQKSKRGRPRKNAIKVPLPPLYVFIRNLLHNRAYNPRVVSWVSEAQGIFKVNSTSDFAKTWGLMKSNRNEEMTYEKMSRAMR